MDEGQARTLLESQVPFDRMTAAQWMAGNATQASRQVLTSALETESVPQIKRHLASALRRVTQAAQQRPENRADGETPTESSSESEAETILGNLAGLIRHETEPAIGWIRRAANREVPDFSKSATNRAIEALRRRIEGVAQLADASRPPIWTQVSLSEIIEESIPPQQSSDEIHVSPAGSLRDDTIETDRGLMALIIGNSVANAMQASVAASDHGKAQVQIEYGGTGQEFWLTISNPFSGSSFTLEQVAGIGTSTKTGHRGLGVLAAHMAASRMNYVFDLTAVGGIATASLRGNRKNA